MGTSPSRLRDSDLRIAVQASASSNYKRQSRPFIRAITASVLLENKDSGRGSKGACRQEELIDGKCRVTVTLTQSVVSCDVYGRLKSGPSRVKLKNLHS
jgi:hypothetical protein